MELDRPTVARPPIMLPMVLLVTGMVGACSATPDVARPPADIDVCNELRVVGAQGLAFGPSRNSRLPAPENVEQARAAAKRIRDAQQGALADEVDARISLIEAERTKRAGGGAPPTSKLPNPSPSEEYAKSRCGFSVWNDNGS